MAERTGMTGQTPNKWLIPGAISVPLGLAAVYLTFFLALLTPVFQRHFIFLHAVRYPFFPDFTDPTRYGIAPFKARNVVLTPTDQDAQARGAQQRKIGAWHILPEGYYQSQLRASRSERNCEANGLSADVYTKALKELPTIIYLHGNAMSRAAPFRIAAYSALTSRIEANVVAIDYRGFGDSDGTPSEEGLVHDAYTAYRWILSHHDGKNRPSVTVFGQSLGTGIAALLAVTAQNKVGQVPPLNNVVLMAPYANLRSLVKDYRIGGTLPVLAPLKMIPFHDLLLSRFMKTHLNTMKALPQLLSPTVGAGDIARRKTNIMLLHAQDDPIIPVSHSHMLFEAALKHAASVDAVQTRSIDGFADIRRFSTHSRAKAETETVVTFIRTHYGGHNHLTEGALDLVRLACGLPSAFAHD